MLLTSVTYLSAMAASNESLHYVSYPTCVLAKSSKLIPTMVVGYLVDRWRGRRRGSGGGGGGDSEHGRGGPPKGINAMEWLGAGLITAGILSFQYVQLRKQAGDRNNRHGGGGSEDEGDSPYGLALLGLSLFMDGVMAACQSLLKQKGGPPAEGARAKRRYRPPSAMETMLYINLYATLLLLAASHGVGQLERGLSQTFGDGDGNRLALLLQLNLSASLGQVFIFLTIHHFSPITCTTITTTRKFFTILLSVRRFGHVLSAAQWAGVAMVFGGLYLEIAAKIVERGRGGSEEEAEEKKKLE